MLRGGGFSTLSETRTMHHWLAAGLGSGWLPKAPGTWGSLTSLIPAWFLVEQVGAVALMAASLALLVVGCWSCAAILPRISDKDPGWIVIDEWAGQWLCVALVFLFLGSSFVYLALSFIAFRCFDILKPWPVSLFERIGPSWWSIMADDIVAGLMGAAVVVTGALVAAGI